MCRTQCLLALVALYVGLAHSWDIAVGVGNELIFYTNGTKTNTVNLISRNIVALAYDQVHNRMLYVDKQSNYDAICSFNLHSEENKCFIERTGSNIHSIAFDPATQTLFFTDTNNNSINSISLKPGSVINVNVNILIKMDDRTPGDIAVDSCTGYIYWTDTINKRVDRARFNGSGREIIIKKYETWEVPTLDVDPLTRKIYYFIFIGSLYRNLIFHADLNGRDQYYVYVLENGHNYVAKELSVSRDYLYWVYKNDINNTIWQLSKNEIQDNQLLEPKWISTFFTEKPLAIATNYKIEDQIQGLQDCEALSSLIQTTTVTDNSLNIEQTTEYTTDVELFCVHGVHVSETSVCNCTPGYIGQRCDVSVCHNYCFQGNCSLNDEGLPTCRCNAGYSSKRCEVYVCHGYCWNDGDCTLNEEDEPVCQCAANHEGSRCETDTSDTATATPTYDLAIRNVTLADLLSRWRKPSSKMFLTVEV